MNNNFSNFKESEFYNEFRDEYEKAQEVSLIEGNYIIYVGEYLYIENGKFYELTNLYYDRNDFQKHIDNEDIVKTNSNLFKLYQVKKPIKVKLIRECSNPNITHYNTSYNQDVSFDINNIDSYL